MWKFASQTSRATWEHSDFEDPVYQGSSAVAPGWVCSEMAGMENETFKRAKRPAKAADRNQTDWWLLLMIICSVALNQAPAAHFAVTLHDGELK